MPRVLVESADEDVRRVAGGRGTYSHVARCLRGYRSSVGLTARYCVAQLLMEEFKIGQAGTAPMETEGKRRGAPQSRLNHGSWRNAQLIAPDAVCGDEVPDVSIMTESESHPRGRQA